MKAKGEAPMALELGSMRESWNIWHESRIAYGEKTGNET